MSSTTHYIIGGLGYVGLATRVWLDELHLTNPVDNEIHFVHVDLTDAINLHNLPARNEKKDLASKIIGKSKLVSPNVFEKMLVDQSRDTRAVVWVCVPTDGESNGLNMKVVSDVIMSLSDLILKHPQIAVCLDAVFIRSTLEVNALSTISRNVTNALNFRLIHMPEFVRQAHIEEDARNPGRYVFGYVDLEYRSSWMEDNFDMDVVIRTSPETSALIKIAANSFLAMKVSFANELASLVDRYRTIDESDVFYALGGDPRIGLLHPSIGYGGYCLPKDANYMRSIIENLDASGCPVLSAIDESNNRRIERITAKVKNYLVGLPRWPQYSSPISILVYGAGVSPDSPTSFAHSPTVRVLQNLLLLLHRGYHDEQFPIAFHIQGTDESTIGLFRAQFEVQYQHYFKPGTNDGMASIMGCIIGNMKLEDRYRISNKFADMFPGRPIFK